MIRAHGVDSEGWAAWTAAVVVTFSAAAALSPGHGPGLAYTHGDLCGAQLLERSAGSGKLGAAGTLRRSRSARVKDSAGHGVGVSGAS